MCGLFGIAGPGIIQQDLKILFDLKIVSMLRGIDGTGVAFGSSHTSPKSFKTIKVPSHGLYFDFSLQKYEKEELLDISNDFYIGHTRLATKGSKNLKATQPFDTSNLIGVHNGTLTGSYHPFNSDSEMLLSAISEFGLEETLNKLCEGDSLALVWIDKTNKCLHFFHNELRDLYFAVNEERQVIYWFSELSLLRAVLLRNQIKFTVLHFTENIEYIINPRSVSKDGKPKLSAKTPTFKYLKLFEGKTANDDGSDLPWSTVTGVADA